MQVQAPACRGPKCIVENEHLARPVWLDAVPAVVFHVVEELLGVVHAGGVVRLEVPFGNHRSHVPVGPRQHIGPVVGVGERQEASRDNEVRHAVRHLIEEQRSVPRLDEPARAGGRRLRHLRPRVGNRGGHGVAGGIGDRQRLAEQDRSLVHAQMRRAPDGMREGRHHKRGRARLHERAVACRRERRERIALHLENGVGGERHGDSGLLRRHGITPFREQPVRDGHALNLREAVREEQHLADVFAARTLAAGGLLRARLAKHRVVAVRVLPEVSVIEEALRRLPHLEAIHLDHVDARSMPRCERIYLNAVAERARGMHRTVLGVMGDPDERARAAASNLEIGLRAIPLSQRIPPSRLRAMHDERVVKVAHGRLSASRRLPVHPAAGLIAAEVDRRLARIVRFLGAQWRPRMLHDGVVVVRHCRINVAHVAPFDDIVAVLDEVRAALQPERRLVHRLRRLGIGGERLRRGREGGGALAHAQVDCLVLRELPARQRQLARAGLLDRRPVGQRHGVRERRVRRHVDVRRHAHRHHQRPRRAVKRNHHSGDSHRRHMHCRIFHGR